MTKRIFVVSGFLALALSGCGGAEGPAACDSNDCPLTDTTTCPGHDTTTCPGHDTTTCPGHDTTTCPGCDTTSCPGYDTVSCPGCDTITCPGCDTTSCPGYDTVPCPGCDTTSCPGYDTVSCPGCDTVECPDPPDLVCPEPDVGDPEDCEDDDPCTAETWTPEAGCVVIPLDGFPCDDGDVCTVGEICQDGACGGGASLACDDGDPCTDDSCDSLSGCQFSPNQDPCDDGDPCTVGDICGNGWCAGSAAATCGDGHFCPGEDCEDGNEIPWDGCDDCAITEFLVPSEPTGDQEFPALAALTGGGWVAVWEGDAAGDPPEILLRGFLPDGAAAGPDQVVNTTTASSQTHPDAVGLAGGGFVAVWQSHGQDGDQGGIVARVFTASGAPAGPEVPVNQVTEDTQYDPAVAPLTDGGFVVAWSTNTDAGIGFNVAARRLDAGAIPLGDEVVVNQYADSVQGNVRVAVDGDQRILVVWNSLNQDGSGNGIVGRVYAGDAAVNDEAVLNEVTLGTQSNPDAAGRPSGGFVVVWQSDGEDGDDYGVFARLLDGDGAPEGGAFPVNTFTANSQRFPAVAATADDGFHVVWQSAWQDGGDFGVFARAFDASGAPQTAEVLLNSHTNGPQDFPDVAALSGGLRVFAWRSAGQDGDGAGVFALRLDADGVKVQH